VPFVLAAARPAAALARAAAPAQRRLERLAEAWDLLRPLEEAAWRGALRPAGLRRLQGLRAAYAALFARRARP
jgi:hypothetical protein